MTNLRFAPPDLGTVLLFTGLPGGSNKIHDRSPYGIIGTITGATWVRLPSGLWCLSFDGNDDSVNCGTGSSFDITTAITVEIWLKWDEATSSNHDGIIFKEDSYYMFIQSGYNWGKFRVIDAFDSSLKNSGAYTLVQNTWTHIVGVYDGVSVEVYQDGVKQGSGDAFTGTIKVDTNPVFIGKSPAGADRFFMGDVALPRVYNRALSALEIANQFNREKHLFGVW